MNAYFDEMGLEGGLLRAEGRVIAYTMGNKLNSNTFDVHIEKAFEDIQGAYQMINHEFAVVIQQNHRDSQDKGRADRCCLFPG